MPVRGKKDPPWWNVNVRFEEHGSRETRCPQRVAFAEGPLAGSTSPLDSGHRQPTCGIPLKVGVPLVPTEIGCDQGGQSSTPHRNLFRPVGRPVAVAAVTSPRMSPSVVALLLTVGQPRSRHGPYQRRSAAVGG